ncbi:MAG: hypothetical protein K4571_00570 [Deltaproteobacteria bacterium]
MVIDSLLSAFPSVASFNDFKENDRDISRQAIPGIIKYAFNHSLIDTGSEEAFVAFLEKNSPSSAGRKLPAGLTFSDVLEKLAGNLSVNALIVQLEITARELSLPEIQAPMMTRLKKRFVVNTPKKRALLRILAFKLAQKYPELGWNYDLLLQLPENPENIIEIPSETAGVTITFHLLGQGEIITSSDVAWLKNELSDCIEYLRLENHIHKKIMETVGATTFNLRAPKKPGPVDEPRLYSEAVRNIIAIAHQMAVRWLLSASGSSQKKLIIIIHAGVLSEANATIHRILDIRLNAESNIYLTDFAHLCTLYASVKAGFEIHTDHVHQMTGYSGDLWSVSNFLSYSYYDYIPSLLEEKMLPRSITGPSYENFRRELHFPEYTGESSFGAIKAMHRFPQSALLLTEIAKVLRARRMPHEADAVLAHLLLSRPLNLTARLMRMLICSNVAQTQPDLYSAIHAFERAEAEGEFIVGHCQPESDIWHEIGMVHFSRAVKYLKYLQGKNPAGREAIQKTDLVERLVKARDAFMKSMAVSATGKALNSLYMISYTYCLIELLPVKNKTKGNSAKLLSTDVRGVFLDVSQCIFRSIGWLNADEPATGNPSANSGRNLLLILDLLIARYENLVLCRSNIPFMKYMFALILWDFAPSITPRLCRIVLGWLKKAHYETEKLIDDNIAVYHVVNGVISADKFLLHIQEAIDVIGRHFTEDDLRQGKDSPLLQAKLKKLSGIKLMLLELERSDI